MKTQSVQLSLVKIPVSSVETAVPYYRDVLGLEEQFSVPEYGWAQFLVGEFPIALYEPGPGGGGSSGECDSVHFSVWIFWLENYAALDTLLESRDNEICQAYINFFSEMPLVNEKIRGEVLFI